jgi:hypothetical protein
MVWLTRANIVVMLTQLKESDRVLFASHAMLLSSSWSSPALSANATGIIRETASARRWLYTTASG